MNLISVIIPTYNRAQYISQSIDSVLAQTYKEIEIIVVDDGSTDNTRDVLQQYGSKIKYIFQKNAGPSAARNKGIKESRGRLLAFLDSDDVWLPEKLECQALLMDQSPDIGLVSCGVYKIDTSGNVFDEPIIKRNFKDKKAFLRELLIHNTIGGGSIPLIRRDCFDKAGLFNEYLWIGEDWDLWLRIAKQYEIKFVEKPLVKYRIHGSNLHANVSRILSRKKIIKQNIEKWHLIALAKAYSYFYLDLAHEYAVSNNRFKVLMYAARAITSYPLKTYPHDDKYKIFCKNLLLSLLFKLLRK